MESLNEWIPMYISELKLGIAGWGKWADPVNFFRGWGWGWSWQLLFLSSTYSQRAAYEPPSRRNWTQWVQWLLKGVRTRMFKEIHSNMWFSREGGGSDADSMPPTTPPPSEFAHWKTREAYIQENHTYVYKYELMCRSIGGTGGRTPLKKKIR